MQDAYEILGLPRLLNVEDEGLSSAFNELSKKYHPDVEGGESSRFEEINSAFKTLETLSSRLKHFHELEFPGSLKGGGVIDEDLMDLFSRITPALQKSDEAIHKHKDSRSALARALVADLIWEAKEALEPLGLEIGERVAEIERGLGQIDEAQERGERDLVCSEVGRAYHRLVFLEKWRAKVRDSMTALAAAALS